MWKSHLIGDGMLRGLGIKLKIISIRGLLSEIENTRKYPLRGYILGVLTHTTALDRLWGGDGTLTMWF